MDPAARHSLVQLDLRVAGITDPGERTPRGLSCLELFLGDLPMALARWPNEGFVTTGEIVGEEENGTFTYSGDRPERWGERRPQEGGA